MVFRAVTVQDGEAWLTVPQFRDYLAALGVERDESTVRRWCEKAHGSELKLLGKSFRVEKAGKEWHVRVTGSDLLDVPLQTQVMEGHHGLRIEATHWDPVARKWTPGYVCLRATVGPGTFSFNRFVPKSEWL